jgi:PhnB protein
MANNDNGATGSAQMTLQPYVFFYGRCEEALTFYQSVLGGSFELQRVSESPMAGQAPPEAQDRIMHAKFSSDGAEFMASDGQDVKAVNPDEGNISLSLSFTDVARAKTVFDALAQGGRVKMPFDDAFWGGKFGMCDDRFGIEWMVTAE